ncbi:MAG: DUF6261 family protein [Tannerellaceae bacterium]|nr:DUF6261 family protein [Tannerellaceae bacterium]
MKKLFPISFKTLLKRLYIGEHFSFYEGPVIEGLKGLLDNLPTVKGMLDSLKIVFSLEDSLFKLSQASFLTGNIARLNEERVAHFIFLWRCVEMADYLPGADVKLAADRLKFLHHTYRALPEMAYYNLSGNMSNFLQDCGIAVNQQAIQLLSSALLIDLAHYINKIKTAHETFMSLYQERSVSRTHVSEIGRLSKVRFEVDAAFDALIDSINVAWAANELGPQDAAVRQNLMDVRDIISAAVHQAQSNLAHRGYHRKKKEKKEDGDARTKNDSKAEAAAPATTSDKASQTDAK